METPILILIAFAVAAVLLSAGAVVLLRRRREDARARALLAAVYNPEYRRDRAASDRDPG